MSTKDYLKGLAITIIPYCKSRKADAVGEIAEVVTEKGNGDSRYWGGNEDETSLILKADQERMHVDFMGTEHEEICRLLNGICEAERVKNTITLLKRHHYEHRN